MQEIERKFLLAGSGYKKEARGRTHIVQGFLNTHPERTVRVRVRDDKAYLTIKGKSDEEGLSRFEWETVIAVSDARELLHLCEEGVLEKYRYEISIGSHLFEVDEFLGRNEGLVIAEIELEEKEAEFPRPSWLGEEVTGDTRYYNSQLSKRPFDTWDD